MNKLSRDFILGNIDISKYYVINSLWHNCIRIYTDKILWNKQFFTNGDFLAFERRSYKHILCCTLLKVIRRLNDKKGHIAIRKAHSKSSPKGICFYELYPREMKDNLFMIYDMSTI